MKVTPDQVATIYSNRFSDADRAAKQRIWKVIVGSFFQKWVREEHTVLDLGCGQGEFLNAIRCRRRLGVDLMPGGQRFLDPAVEFHQGSVCELDHLDAGSVDVVFTSNLMEHLPGKSEAEQMLSEARRVLRPGGHFIAMGPNIRLLANDYWDFWDHLVPISDRSLAEALVTQGYSVDAVYPRFLPYTTKSRLPRWAWLVWCYLKCRPAWSVLGKQFLVIARKPLPAFATVISDRWDGVRRPSQERPVAEPQYAQSPAA
jgi:dolichol-phosphate mannosyltransferase